MFLFFEEMYLLRKRMNTNSFFIILKSYTLPSSVCLAASRQFHLSQLNKDSKSADDEHSKKDSEDQKKTSQSERRAKLANFSFVKPSPPPPKWTLTNTEKQKITTQNNTAFSSATKDSQQKVRTFKLQG